MIDRVRKAIEDHNGLLEMVFLCCFGCYYMYVFLGTTMFDATWLVPAYRLSVVVVTLLLAVKMMTIDRNNFKIWAAGFLVLLCFFLQWLRTSDKAILILGIFILASKDVPFRKSVWVSTVIGCLIMIAAFVSSQLGIIEDLVYYLEGTYRHSFGIIYSTDFAAHVFFLVLGYCFLRRGRLKGIEYVIIFLIAILVYIFSRAKTNTICLVLIGLSLAVWQYPKVQNRIPSGMKQLTVKLMVALIPICAAIMLFCTAGYNPEKKVWIWLNQLLNGRLVLGHQGMEQYGISLLGKTIHGAGFARTTTPPPFYFALDSSYVSILLAQGLLFFVMICLMFFYCSYIAYKRKLVYLLIILSIIGIQCMIEHHMTDISYNVFLLLAFSDFGIKKEDEHHPFVGNIIKWGSSFTKR